MQHEQHNSKSKTHRHTCKTIGAVAGLAILASAAEAGTLFLDHFAETTSSFESSWTWSTGGGGPAPGQIPGHWAAPRVRNIGTFWDIALEGFGGAAPNAVGDLIDVSEHLFGPHGEGRAGSSWFFYAGATNGLNTVATTWDHGDHVDLYELETVRTGPHHVAIRFDGWHVGEDDPGPDYFRVPAPGAIALLALGGVTIARRRR